MEPREHRHVDRVGVVVVLAVVILFGLRIVPTLGAGSLDVVAITTLVLGGALALALIPVRSPTSAQLSRLRRDRRG